ncbi:hypothetical protein [Neobacillus mesonae]|nr:hypothetical protein [Neobacillus mesonae]
MRWRFIGHNFNMTVVVELQVLADLIKRLFGYGAGIFESGVGI